MDIPIIVAISIYIASIVVTHFRGIFADQIKVYFIILVGWIVTFLLRFVLSKTLDLDKVGIVIAAFIISLDKIWIVYVGPLTAILTSILRKKG